MKEAESKPWRSIGESIDEPLEIREQVWGKIIETGSITMLYGYRGSYKSLFASSLVHAICGGYKFLKWYPERPFKCLVIDGEMGRQNVVKRFISIAQASNIPVQSDKLNILTYQDCKSKIMWNLSNPAHQVSYAKAFAEHEVIVIDNLLTCSGPIKNFDSDFDQWQRIQPFLINERDKGKAIILIHHAGKGGAQYGTVLRENTMSTIIKLERHATAARTVNLTFEKTRDYIGEDDEALQLEIHDNNWSYWSHSQREFDEIVARLKAGEKKKDIAEAMGLDYAKVLLLTKGVRYANSN